MRATQGVRQDLRLLAEHQRCLDMHFTSQELGLMAPDELDEIRHCRLCLETYVRCSCREGVERRKA